jgi:undecaprenyl-diphosphatase
MESHPLFAALLMGIIEGLTEFLPISSTGHLILLGHAIGFQGPPGKVFEIAIQLGAILAVVVIYWRRLLAVTSRPLRAWLPLTAPCTPCKRPSKSATDCSAVSAHLAWS